MTTKNDITGDLIKTKTEGQGNYRDNYDKIFGKKNQKIKQKSMTELNWDGDEEETNKDEISQNSVRREQPLSRESSSK
jgi:hypothetical protein